MLVGEQPSNDEDEAGKPFVGPAGRVLDRALESAEISRGDVFVTNAVKHFKFRRKGKRRLHERPNSYEIERCKWWNEYELELVKPLLIVGLGATAAFSILGRRVTIKRERGNIITTPDGRHAMVTAHPSYLLRIRERADRELEMAALIKDLSIARDYIAA